MAAGRPASRPAGQQAGGRRPAGRRASSQAGARRVAAGKPAAAVAWRGRFYQGVLLAGNCRAPAAIVTLSNCHAKIVSA